MHIKIHDIVPITIANGPGKRFGIWVQGCEKQCTHCFNPETHDINGGYNLDIADLVKEILESNEIEGISISGGEPFLQTKKLITLISELKKINYKLTVLIYTGFTIEELQKNETDKDLLALTDILIAGPYLGDQKIHQPLLSSANQKIHFLTNRYTMIDVDSAECEYIIAEDGTITITGSNI